MTSSSSSATVVPVTILVLLVAVSHFGTVSSAVVRNDTNDSSPHCLVTRADGVPVEMSIGSTWTLPADPCMRHTCQLVDASNATETRTNVAQTVVKSSREYCTTKCQDDFELITPPGVCCGQCQQTKCRHPNVDEDADASPTTLHSIGDMWKDADGCTFHECVRTADNLTTTTSYSKTCPPIPPTCPPARRAIRDCCAVCDSADSRSASADGVLALGPDDGPTFNATHHALLMDPLTYLQHPCARDCQPGAAPMVCNYTFIIEWYETLSKACYECPQVAEDCYRPHCVAGDGMRRSIVTINRMMPGPRLQVCLGDTLQVDVVNQMLADSTTIHWHGMHQRRTPLMDGVPMVSQCPVGPHQTFRYTFEADHEGTHWWHSHTGMQRSDGALGALVVRRPEAEVPEQVRRLYEYDLAEHTMFVQDWEHVAAASGFGRFHHAMGSNKPKNIIINGRGKFGEPQPRVAEEEAVTEAAQVTGEVTAEEGEAVHPNDVDALQLESATEPIVEATTNQSNSTAGARFRRQAVVISATDPDPIPEALLAPVEIFRVAGGGAGYRFRHINAGFLNCPVEISIDEHNLTVIASDGWYFEPVEVATLVTYAGERFDFVVHANQPVGNYWVRVRGLMDCDERWQSAFQVAVLRYDGAAEDEWPTAEWPTWEYERVGLQMNALNRGTGLVDSVSVAELTALHETDASLLRAEADLQFYVYYDFYDRDNPHYNFPNLYSNENVTNPQHRFIMPQLNRITMRMPSSPLMVARDRIDQTRFCNESSLAAQQIDCSDEFCECSHVLQVPLNATVELVLVDEGYRFDANHPFHLHGHGFQVVAMERLQPTGITVQEIQALDRAGKIPRRLRGSPTKDTITVPDGGYTIVRFRADNPGYWLFHCHIEFHAEVGMALVFKVGEHHQMQPVPADFPQCGSYQPQLGVNKDGGAGQLSWSAWNAAASASVLYAGYQRMMAV